jgi:hypothetical protein
MPRMNSEHMAAIEPFTLVPFFIQRFGATTAIAGLRKCWDVASAFRTQKKSIGHYIDLWLMTLRTAASTSSTVMA